MNHNEKDIAPEGIEANTDSLEQSAPEGKAFELNHESDIGISSSSTLVAEHKFRWSPKEFVMIGGMLVGGTVISIFVLPFFFGLMLVAGGIGLGLVNQQKKKMSVLQLYQTSKGLRVYHKGELVNAASTANLSLERVGEVSVSESNNKQVLVLKGSLDHEVTGFDYLRIPVRLARSKELSAALDSWILNPKVKVSKGAIELHNKFKKIDKRG